MIDVCLSLRKYSFLPSFLSFLRRAERVFKLLLERELRERERVERDELLALPWGFSIHPIGSPLSYFETHFLIVLEHRRRIAI